MAKLDADLSVAALEPELLAKASQRDDPPMSACELQVWVVGVATIAEIVNKVRICYPVSFQLDGGEEFSPTTRCHLLEEFVLVFAVETREPMLEPTYIPLAASLPIAFVVLAFRGVDL